MRSRSCVLSGVKAKPTASMNYRGSVSPAVTPTGASPAHGGSVRPPFAGKGAKDVNIGKTVMIIRGQYKGYQAQVIDATETHFQVELLARLKKISIERDKTVTIIYYYYLFIIFSFLIIYYYLLLLYLYLCLYLILSCLFVNSTYLILLGLSGRPARLTNRRRPAHCPTHIRGTLLPGYSLYAGSYSHACRDIYPDAFRVGNPHARWSGLQHTSGKCYSLGFIYTSL